MQGAGFDAAEPPCYAGPYESFRRTSRVLSFTESYCSMPPSLFRVIIPVPDIDMAVAFYSRLLDMPGQRIAPGRHYFHCGPTILAIVDPSGHQRQWRPNPELVYFAVPNLEEAFQRAQHAGGTSFTRTTPAGASRPIPGASAAFTSKTPTAIPFAL